MIKIDDIKAYDVQEVAEMLHISAQTVRAYIKQGKLKAQKTGNKYVITEETLKAFIKGGVEYGNI